jgi:hypothetical protein
MILLAPQINGALFATATTRLWYGPDFRRLTCF